jgi:hypothetical protein
MRNINQSKCLRSAATIADRIIASAKSDKHGIYWENALRSADAVNQALTDISLLNGTSGILLFLAEYYRQAPDPHLAELLEKGLAWLKNRANDAPPCHGFYCGHPGYLYARIEIQRCLGRGLEPEEITWANEMITKLMVGKPAPFSNLAAGTAGTLLALAAIRPDQIVRENHGWTRELLRRLARQARLTDRGIYWDRYSIAARPCIGFLTGNSGIEYVLSSHRSDDPTDGAAWLTMAAVAYDNGEFDAVSGNWRDYSHREYFQNPHTVEKLREAATNGDMAKFLVFGDSAGWSDGAAGVLISRLAMAESDIPSAATLDIDRAVQRIYAEAAKLSVAESRFTLRDGWGGMALSLAGASAGPTSAQIEDVVGQIVNECLAQQAKLGKFRTGTDLNTIGHGLFTGEAGIGYFLLRIAAENPASTSILRPVGGQIDLPAPFLNQRECLNALIKWNFPQTSRLFNDRLPVETPARLTYADVLASLAKAVPAGLARSVFEHEAEKLKNEKEQDVYNFIWSASLHRRQKHDLEWANAADTQLEGESIRLEPSIQIGKVAFRLDPQDRLSLPVEGSTFILLESSFDGIHEYILPPISYAIYSHLKQPVSVRELTDILIKKYPSLVKAAGDNLQAAIIQHIRAGLRSDFLMIER